MFLHLSLVASLAGLAAPASGASAPLCGSGGATRGNAEMILHFLNAPTDHHSPYVGVTARNEDGSYSFSVGYRPTERGLGRPHIVHVYSLIGFAGEADARPLRLEWRAPGETWSSPRHWATPQRHFPQEEPRFRAHYRLGQGLPFPHGTEVLDNLANGVRYEFRSLDEQNRLLGSGAAVYPPQRVIEEMYAEARAQALGRMAPCDDGPAPMMVPVAPPASNK